MTRIAVAWVILGCGFTPEADDHTTEGKLAVGSLTRTYCLHVPPSLPADKPAPLVLVFHGGGGDGRSMETSTGFSSLSDKKSFLVCYPDGIDHGWNDGRIIEGSIPHRDHIDDLGFANALIDEISRSHPVDPKRIYATGLSNGGFLCHFLAARHSSRIAAIAPVAGGIAPTVAAEFKPDRPVSVMIVQGVEDPIVPFKGGTLRHNRGETLPTQTIVQKWVDHNGCGAPTTEELFDRDPEDGTRVKKVTYSGGHEETEVVEYIIEGGGHTWPGGPQYLPASIIGRVSKDIDATPLIWEFFDKHPKK